METSSFTTPSLPWDTCHRSKILYLFFVFIFCPSSFSGDWLSFLEVWGILLLLRSCSVGVVPHSNEFFMYFLDAGDLAILLFCYLLPFTKTSFSKGTHKNFICTGTHDKSNNLIGASVQFSSVAQSCPILCDPMDCSTPGLLVHQQLPEFTQTHVH